ncbi:DNA cytosine methyltransferase [Paenibacillus sp. 2TAB23]|uniref:DNA cytosine methyltransferase n=1 Tax=Paenibacillus sp. 2TAB23 TaxID=3233004 RepID=UPI003F9C4BA7
MENKPHIFSFFSGAGFLDLGFEHSNFEIAFVNEFHEPFCKAYEYSREKLEIDEPVYGCHNTDVITYTVEPEKTKLSNFIKESRKSDNTIGFIGGPPCPDFSVGGKNKGSEGENGRLTATYVDLICQQQPDFFVLENVKGLWRTKKHRIFYDSILDKLKQSGYIMTDRVINALEYGVAQHRERIILFGINQSYLESRNLSIDTEQLKNCFPWDKNTKYSMDEIKSYSWPEQADFEENSELKIPNGIPEELTVEYWFKKNIVDSHPNNKAFTPKAALPRFKVIPEGDDSKKSYKRLHRWRYSPTAAYGNNEVHLHPYKARRLTISEALAIQSLPKEFELPETITLSNAFKTVGNGVPYLAAKGIANTIMDFLQDINTTETVN